jgi:hypothetical protein
MVCPAASAATPAARGVAIEAGACPELDTVRLDELAAIEISTASAGSTLAPTLVTLTCDGDRVAIAATDRQSGQEARSEVRLQGTAESARLRLLALAISELLATREMPAALRPAPTASPAAVLSPASGAVGEARPPRFHVTAAGSCRRAGAPATWLGGIVLGGEVRFARALTLAVEGSGESGATATALASVDWLATSATVALLAGVGVGAWRFEAGPGFELGWVRLSAHASAAGSQGRTITLPWAGPLGRLHVTRALGRRFFVLGRFSAGWVTHAAHGDSSDGRTLLDLSRGWFGLGVGAGLFL